MERFAKGIVLMTIGLLIMSPVLYLQYVKNDFDSLLWLGWIGAIPFVPGTLFAYTGFRQWLQRRVQGDDEVGRRY